MEKHIAVEREGDDFKSIDGDMISQLPQHILHHILCFLSQKEAVRTCVLSKLWRCLGSTRPKIEFSEKWFKDNKETFMPIIDKTLQKYHDQNLSIQDFDLSVKVVDPKSIPLLEKWIPIVMLNLGLKTFGLRIRSKSLAYFDLPSAVFKAESLQELHLLGCNLNQTSINVVDKVRFKHLRTLYLWGVCIADETFEKIMLSCPMIECLVLNRCEGLRTIQVTNKHHKLKKFTFVCFEGNKEDKDYCSIEIDVQTIERIIISGCWEWVNHHNTYFSNLKCLNLWNVRLSTTNSFDIFSSKFPCLEDFTLEHCYGFQELQLSSCSIKRLTLMGFRKSIKATIDAPNILYFKYKSDFLPSSMCFTTTSGHEWKSDVILGPINIEYSLWFLKLYEVLQALSQSRITLDLPFGHQYIEYTNNGGVYQHAAVEHLVLRGLNLRSYFTAFLNWLFRTCHPRYISAHNIWGHGDEKLIKYLSKILLHKRKRRDYCFWERDLEEVRMEASENRGGWWHPIQGTSVQEYEFLIPLKFRFRCKWRDLR